MTNSDKDNISKKGGMGYEVVNRIFYPLIKHPKKTIAASIILGTFCFYWFDIRPQINQQTEENIQPSTKLEYIVKDANQLKIVEDSNHPK